MESASGDIALTMRSRSSIVANSTVILPLLPAHLHLDPSLEKVRETVGQVAEGRGDRLRGGRPAGRLLRACRPPRATISSTERTESPSATMRWASRSWACGSSRESSARAWPALITPAATRFCTRGRQVQQPERVADVRAGPADLLRELFVRGAEVVEQLLIGGRLFERVELLPVQVLQQRVAQHVGVRRLADDRGDVLQAGPLGRAPAALAHDELVVFRRRSS